MALKESDHYGTITKIDGLQMPNVKFRWRPLTYTNFFGNPSLIQAVRSFDSVNDALRLLRYTLKQQHHNMKKLGVDPQISKQIGYLYFRGQSNIEWPLLPTIYRNLPEKKGEREISIVDRIGETVKFFQDVSTDPMAQNQVPDFNKMSIEQRRAVARHYGMRNEYIDLTTDPHVAAFFATMDSSIPSGNSSTGVIFMLNLDLFFSLFQWERKVDSEGLFLSLSLPQPFLDLPYLSINKSNEVVQNVVRLNFKSIKGPLFSFRWLNPGRIHRIEVQKATFLRVGGMSDGLYDEHTINWLGSPEAWKLIDFLSFKFTFPQRKPYHSFLRRIYKKRLLPSGERLEEIAKDILKYEGV